MSAREHVYHAERCRAKLAYDTRAKAVRAKRRRERAYGHRMQVYRCPYCAKWHLTSKPWGARQDSEIPRDSRFTNGNKQL